MSRYYLERYGAESSYIPYGCATGPEPRGESRTRFGVERGGYLLCVARLEPENNVDLIVREYKRSGSKFPLLVVGSSPYPSAHARSVLAMADDRVRCLGSVFEPELLNGLYSDCRLYLHGHEVGGTNPSLLRAMGAGAPCVAIDVPFHREVLGPEGRYFSKEPGALAARINELEADAAFLAVLAERGRSRAQALYRWDAVAAAYAELFEAVIRASRAGRRFRQEAGFEPYRPLEFGPGGSSTA
jgi:glycosyltransferase involved in cell wall biosynthesis